MKVVFRLLLIYVLFLIQTAIPRLQLDLALLAVVILALHDPPLYALITACWTGFLLDLLNPLSFGFHIVIITVIAYGANNIRRFIYKEKIYFIVILLLSILFKYITSLIFLKATQTFLMWFIATVIILIISVPLESLITNIFYHQWKMNITENNY